MFGLGLPPDALDHAQLDATAAVLAGEGMGLSPGLAEPTSFNQVPGSLIEAIDAFPIVDPATGKVGLRLVRDGASLADWNESDFTTAPEVQADGWGQTINLLTVRFVNRLKGWSADGVSFRDRGNFALTGALRSRNVERPWVTRQAVAWRIAACLGRQLALPALQGSCRVRRSSIVGVSVGDLVTLTHGAGGMAGLKATLNAGLDAGTLDDAVLDLTVTSDDWELEETTQQEALSTQALQVFIGDQITVHIS